MYIYILNSSIIFTNNEFLYLFYKSAILIFENDGCFILYTRIILTNVISIENQKNFL